MKSLAVPKIQSLLLRWFRRSKRSLPWRETHEPYKIWVSEIMLQQTQVNTVIPYYNRWMKKFPSLERLAQAPLSRVLKGWEGLGYYTRARNLHRTAKLILQKFRSKFPDSPEELQKLPGIGRYTAGAIASIAFGKPEPVLDGNVKRVLSRLSALREPVDQAPGEKKLWELATKLVSVSIPFCGDFNQALMELGALVCLPENPGCSICPVQKLCRAHRLKREEAFPVKSRKEKIEALKTVAVILWKNGRVLLKKQPLHARWGGLWTFPQWVYTNGKVEKRFLEEKVRRYFGIKTRSLGPKAELRHRFTKYRVRLRVYEAEVLSSRQKLRWVRPQNLSRFVLPAPHQKIAKLTQS